MEEQEGQEVKDGIQLFDPGWGVEIRDRGFRGQDVVIPEIGVVYLTGSTALDYLRSARGLAILNDEVVVKSATELHELGLYDTWVVLKSAGGPKRDLTCSMSLPDGQVLDGKMDFTFGEDASPPHWELSGEEVDFFAQADPKFLSSLRFNFGS